MRQLWDGVQRNERKIHSLAQTMKELIGEVQKIRTTMEASNQQRTPATAALGNEP